MPASPESSMARALALAQATTALASPNPQVGCVLVRDGNIIGQGAHLYDQRDHAEIVALKAAAAAGHSPRGADAFVTLEPCAHHGRTPPCAAALIAAGIARCFVATADPNPLVSGAGIRKLRAAGIAVHLGLLQSPARALNDAFAFSITHRRPFVTLKSALSADGMLAPPPAARTANQPFWLTSPAARERVQQLRHASDAILTGIGTVLADDPLLTDRTALPRRRPLLRVVLDTHLRTPPTAKLAATDPQSVRIFASDQTPRTPAFHALESRGVTIIPTPILDGSLDLEFILNHLHQTGILSVLLEAGSALNAAFLRHQLIDRLILFYAQHTLGPGAIPFARGLDLNLNPDPSSALGSRLTRLHRETLGPDLIVSGLLHDPWPIIPEPVASQPSTA